MVLSLVLIKLNLLVLKHAGLPVQDETEVNDLRDDVLEQECEDAL